MADSKPMKVRGQAVRGRSEIPPSVLRWLDARGYLIRDVITVRLGSGLFVAIDPEGRSGVIPLNDPAIKSYVIWYGITNGEVHVQTRRTPCKAFCIFEFA